MVILSEISGRTQFGEILPPAGLHGIAMLVFGDFQVEHFDVPRMGAFDCYLHEKVTPGAFFRFNATGQYLFISNLIPASTGNITS